MVPTEPGFYVLVTTFEGDDRVVETGVHGPYLEVWERVPESLGPTLALVRGRRRKRLLVATPQGQAG